jgi:HlyD family secretion protein
MADLSLVQVRTLVDETDIGKIRPGLHATVSVASYPNQPFEGQVLKIEPMAETQQNVTMFPVLIRIPNTDGLLRPGMNAEVEISIGRREGVLAVPNAALRTDRDVGSAAEVLGLTLEAVQAQLARSPQGPGRQASSLPAAESNDRETLTLRNGRTVELPPGVTADQARTIMNKRRSGESLTEKEQEIGRQIFQGFRGGPDAEPDRAAVSEQRGADLQVSDYVVFVLRDGAPTAVRIKTGLTDLDYSEVLSGLTAADSVLVLRNITQQAS